MHGPKKITGVTPSYLRSVHASCPAGHLAMMIPEQVTVIPAFIFLQGNRVPGSGAGHCPYAMRIFEGRKEGLPQVERQSLTIALFRFWFIFRR